jgi:hypothetical protein
MEVLYAGAFSELFLIVAKRCARADVYRGSAAVQKTGSKLPST